MTPHRTRLGVPLRAGWLVREQVELAPPDGSLHVVAHSEPVTDIGSADFAAGYGELFAEHLPGYEEIDVRDVQLFGGRPAVLRRYRHVPADGAPLTQIAAYLVEDGIGHVVTATTTTSRFASVEGDLLTLLTQFGLDRSAVTERPSPPFAATASPSRSPAGGPVSAPWRGKQAKGSRSDVSTLADLSADELVALAQLFGHERFPYLDEADAADATGDSGAAVVRSALRSLAARGLLTTSETGSPAAREDLGRAVGVALDPLLAVTVEVEGDGGTLVALALDDERCVELLRRSGGVYTLRDGSAAALLDRLAELTGAEYASKEATGTAAQVPAVAIDRARAFARTGDADGASREIAEHADLLDALLDAASVSRVRAVHRAEGAVHGGELVWLQTKQGMVWILEPTVDGEGATAATVVARPTGRDDLYAELLALLP
jgi:hypothetical protein